MISTANTTLRLPEFLRKSVSPSADRRAVHALMRQKSLNTVCEEARCPNISECFTNKTATFMILGDRCTRRCHFCSVQTGRPLKVDPQEADRLADAALELGLKHIVITSVDRDELADCGAHHFAHVIKVLRERIPDAVIELLTPDFKGKPELLDIVIESKPHIWGHNIETVERLYRQVRPQSNWKTTSFVLDYVAKQGVQTKSGMMVGLGETNEEVELTLQHLVRLGVQIATVGQYLRPTLKQWPVARYVSTEQYDKWASYGKQLGLKHVYAGPFVRSSYHAEAVHQHAIS